jgi:hypothetical protein
MQQEQEQYVASRGKSGFRQRKATYKPMNEEEKVQLSAISSNQHVKLLFQQMLSNLLIPLLCSLPPLFYILFVYSKLLIFFTVSDETFHSHVKWIGVTRWDWSSYLKENEGGAIADQILSFVSGCAFLLVWLVFLVGVLVMQVDWKNLHTRHVAILTVTSLFCPLISSAIMWVLLQEPALRAIASGCFSVLVLLLLRFKFIPMVKREYERERAEKNQYQVLISQ